MARMAIDPMPPRLLSPFVHDIKMLPIAWRRRADSGAFRKSLCRQHLIVGGSPRAIKNGGNP
jgi:hypothetical protein